MIKKQTQSRKMWAFGRGGNYETGTFHFFSALVPRSKRNEKSPLRALCHALYDPKKGNIHKIYFLHIFCIFQFCMWDTQTDTQRHTHSRHTDTHTNAKNRPPTGTSRLSSTSVYILYTTQYYSTQCIY